MKCFFRYVKHRNNNNLRTYLVFITIQIALYHYNIYSMSHADESKSSDLSQTNKNSSLGTVRGFGTGG